MGFAVRRYQPVSKKVLKCPLLSQANVDLTTPVDDILDTIEYEYGSYEFLGDAYPNYNLDCFGPGLVAAFLGAELDNSTGRVWFLPKEKKDLENLHFEYDEDSPWLKRVLDLVSRAYERFGNKLLFSMPDLGGVLDILSSFLPGDELLYALYDNPEAVKKLTAELDDLWMRFYKKIAQAGHFDEIGYTDWSGVYSTKPTYIMQCDFSYMISNEMFREFALPSLVKHANLLDNSIYHLDGVGEIKHLDDILSIEKLKAVQWVHGAGQKPYEEWTDIFERILSGGKLLYILNFGLETMDKIAEQVGNASKMVYQFTLPSCVRNAEDREYLLGYLKKYKVEI